LSALHTDRLYPPRNIPGPVRSCLRRTQGHSAAGMKNSNDTIGKRTRDLTAWSVVPQPTATPRASMADEWECMWSTGGIILKEERVVMGGNAVPISLGPPQIPRGLSWDLSRASVVKGRLQSATGMARPFPNKGSSTRLRVCIITRQQTKRKFISSARNRL
jgi:hypothetical protein